MAEQHLSNESSAQRRRRVDRVGLQRKKAHLTQEPAAVIAAVKNGLAEALADTSPLTDEQRRARAGLTNRQVTLR